MLGTHCNDPGPLVGGWSRPCQCLGLHPLPHTNRCSSPQSHFSVLSAEITLQQDYFLCNFWVNYIEMLVMILFAAAM